MNLTTEQIDNLPAGPEMNALIAERVMGWSRGAFSTDNYPAWRTMEGTRTKEFWNPSTFIAAALEVIEKIKEPGDTDIFIEWWRDGEWFVTNKPLTIRDGAVWGKCDGKKTGIPSLSLAICRFVLKFKLAQTRI